MTAIASARTPSQTIGPFFHAALPRPGQEHLVGDDATGAIVLSGRVLDGAGVALPDALVEIWQFAGPGRAGTALAVYGRSHTNDDGRYRFVTVRPAPVPDATGILQAPHAALVVFARGLLKGVVTRVYFGDEVEANASDPVLQALDPVRSRTLVARPSRGGFEHDVVLQGDAETVFFAF